MRYCAIALLHPLRVSKLYSERRKLTALVCPTPVRPSSIGRVLDARRCALKLCCSFCLLLLFCLFQLVYSGEKEVRSPPCSYTHGCTLSPSLSPVCCVVCGSFPPTIFPGQLIHPSLPQAAGPSPQQTRTCTPQYPRCVLPTCSYTHALMDPLQLITEMYQRGVTLTPSQLQSILAPPSPSFTSSNSPHPAGRFVYHASSCRHTTLYYRQTTL